MYTNTKNTYANTKIMYTSTFIRKHIFNLPEKQIFSTRDFLAYGKRAAVDKCLSRLVKRDIIVRLARGLFMKQNFCKFMPPAAAVAAHKAKAFGKEIMVHARDTAKAFGLIDDGNPNLTYFIPGKSSSFRFGQEVIHFHGLSGRKLHLIENQVALAIQALWYMGHTLCSQEPLLQPHLLLIGMIVNKCAS